VVRANLEVVSGLKVVRVPAEGLMPAEGLTKLGPVGTLDVRFLASDRRAAAVTPGRLARS
jgi:hypothetical protein